MKLSVENYFFTMPSDISKQEGLGNLMQNNCLFFIYNAITFSFKLLFSITYFTEFMLIIIIYSVVIASCDIYVLRKLDEIRRVFFLTSSVKKE